MKYTEEDVTKFKNLLKESNLEWMLDAHPLEHILRAGVCICVGKGDLEWPEEPPCDECNDSTVGTTQKAELDGSCKCIGENPPNPNCAGDCKKWIEWKCFKDKDEYFWNMIDYGHDCPFKL